MISVTRRIQFCAGHRLCNHEGKCAYVHGHNYVLYLHATADELDDVGRVIDFEVLKQRIGTWIDEHWDHGFIVYKDDHVTREAMSAIPGQKLFVLDENPTVENLALYVLNVVGPECLADTDVRLVKVVLWETENCGVEISA